MNNEASNRRAQVREEISKTSREEFILKEMKRMGFWPHGKEKPTLEEEVIKRKSELQKEIRELSKKNRRYENREAELNRYKKARLKKSKEQQKLNKEAKREEQERKKSQFID